MNTHHLLDPEIAAVLDQLPVARVSRETLAQVRADSAQVIELIRAATPPYPQLEVSEQRVPGPKGAPEVRVVVTRPRVAASARAALLWIHGGGFVAGSPEFDDGRVKQIVDAVGCVVVSVDYRLAPETPHPGPVEDCYAALAWLHAEAETLGVDRRRIGIAGLSAGGGLCAALGLLARDRGQIPLCFMAPLQPMLDDRSACGDHAHPTVGEFVWTRDDNHFGWSALLGHEPGAADVSPYAAAARADDLAGLPPTYIAIGTLDLFLDESIEFTRRLVRAGVPAELHLHPGACHGFDVLAPDARVSRDYRRDLLAALKRGLGVEPEVEAAADPGLMAQLAAMLPGIPQQDQARFVRSLGSPEPYAPGPDARPRDGVPGGTVTRGHCEPGRVYPGVAHDYACYVPAQTEPGRPLALMVFLDGDRYLGPEVHAAAVLDNLIAEGALPPTMAVFVNPGANGPGLPIYGGSDNRSVEYDSLGDGYARFLLDELLPQATRGMEVSGDPAQRAIVGLSSGAICAFNVAWERPDAFGKVVSHCGSYTNIRGGHQLAPAVRASAAKPLRVFLQTGEHDLNILFGDWVLANRTLASALSYRGYDHQLVVGRGGHSLAHGGAIFPDTLRWLWRASS